MDTDAISNITKVSVQGPKPKPQTSSTDGNEAAPPPQSSLEDTVSLSVQVRQAGNVPKTESNAPRTQDAQNRQRQFDVENGNQLVLKIVDGTTGRVVKQIPAAEQLRLQQAIQDGIKNFDL